MANPYSYDLRKKVIEAIELNGMKRVEASAAFNISRNTINTWFQRRAETGDFHPKVREQKNKRQKITDWEKFQAFVEEHGDKTQSEMANLWEVEISERTICRALKKIGFTRKKKLMATEKETKRKGKNLERK
jgi:transposase